MRSPTTALTAAVVVCLALPAASPAATTFTREGDAYVLRGDPGPDAISLRGDDDGRIVFSGQAAAAPALGCTTSMWDSDAHCPPGAVRVEAGDGNDTVSIDLTMPAGSITVLGQGGDDKLTGHDGPSTLDGGPGNDVVIGNGGADTVLGGEGDDEVGGDGFTSASPDVVDGGPGTDRAATGSWLNPTSGAPTPAVTVSLDGVANDGRPGEGDNVTGLEQIKLSNSATLVAGGEAVDFEIPSNAGTVRARLAGSPQADRLKAAHGADELDGGAGDDTLEGGYGDDVITGGPGRDRINADASGGCDFVVCNAPVGNDTVQARDGEADTIDCGVGTDRAVVDTIDTVANCETVDAGGSASPAPGGGTKTPGKGACVVPKVARGATLASARAKLKRAGCASRTVKVRSKTVRKGRVVRLSRRAKTRLKAGAKVTVYVSRGRR